MYSRREFGRLLGMSLPLTVELLRSRHALAADEISTVNGVRLGLITYSFRDMPNVQGQDHIDLLIQDCQACGVGLIELMCNHAEPVTAFQIEQDKIRAARMAAVAASGSPPAPNTGMSARRINRPPSPEALKARAELRAWRLRTPMSHFEEIRKKFSNAGITVYAYCVNGMGTDFTDPEIDKMFEQAQTLGASVVSTSTTLDVA